MSKTIKRKGKKNEVEPGQTIPGPAEVLVVVGVGVVLWNWLSFLREFYTYATNPNALYCSAVIAVALIGLVYKAIHGISHGRISVDSGDPQANKSDAFAQFGKNLQNLYQFSLKLLLSIVVNRTNDSG